METLYTKYRPKNFDEVFGQKTIKNFFINSIDNKNLHHSFIFSGPRGTGKTTVARIVAKTLNCENRTGYNPCNQCKSCIAIDRDSSIDVMEMDAASNRGVDDIREIQQKSYVRPLYGKYKIFIIDEVHSLTNYAFEALLKIIEEPPSYVMFIFATTQFIKIPDTVRSRCEKLFFRKLSDIDLMDNLKLIVNKENINIDNRSLSLIVQYSNGIARESVSNLNQLISQFGYNITSNLIIETFGLVDLEDKKQIIKGVLSKNKKIIYEILNKLETKGVQIDVFISEIVKSCYKLIYKIENRNQMVILWSLIKSITSFEMDIRYISNPYPFLYALILEVIYKNS